MSNIFNNNFYEVKTCINYDEYWDLILDKTYFHSYSFSTSKNNQDCLISMIDAALYDCVFENEICSVDECVWDKSITKKYDLVNIGNTGFDNGLLFFRKDQIMNKDFLELYQNSKYTINDDKKLILHQVTGSTMVYEYPITVEDFQIKLNGGFYQGFFKTDCDKYQVLPSVLENGETWSYEFVLKKSDLPKESDKTLNDKHPNNKGIFFYLGTRAENKWDYLYNNQNDDCFTLSPDDYVENAEINVKNHKLNSFLDVSISMPIEWDKIALDEYISYDITKQNQEISPLETFMQHQIEDCCDFSKCNEFAEDYVDFKTDDFDDLSCSYEYVESDIDISDFVYKTDSDFIIGKHEKFLDTNNKFLLFDRTCNGLNVNTWKEDSYIRYIYEPSTFDGNLFLLMNRTCTGYTVDTIEKLKQQYTKKYNIYEDLYNNALGFRITDNGKIGYRYLIADCTSNEKPYQIVEGYSKPNIIQDDVWSIIHIQIIGLENAMKIKIYVNGLLVFVSKELPKINLRKLQENEEKQETVPYNISIGGGTQGLCDVILPNYMIEPYRLYPLEEYFAGSFIGYFKSFKMYTCNLEYMDILNNFKHEINNLNLK